MLILTRKVGEAIDIPSLDVSITVQSVRGSRTRLAVSAPPEIPVDRTEVRSPASPQPQSRFLKLPVDGIRVLLADADTAYIARHETHLSRLGFEVSGVSDACECVRWLRNRTPHVLVLDAGLLWGRAEGVLALMEEHRAVPAVPVLVSHSEAHRPGLRSLRHFGICGFVNKSLAPQQLAAHVRRSIPVHTEDPASRC